MQPTPEDLQESFKALLEQVLFNAKAHSDQQELLGSYLRAHPELFTVRFRSSYLKDDFNLLIRELTRTCSVTEENIDLLQDIVKGVDSRDLDNVYKRHQLLIKRRKNPDYTTIKPAISTLLMEKMGKKWSQFSHSIGITDGTVDEIDQSSENNSLKMEKVLEWINLNVNHDRQMAIILQGLKDSGRRDLEDEVEALLIK